MKKDILFIDPRTKVFLLFVISSVMLNTVSKGLLVYVRPFVALLPFILLLTSKRFKASFSYLAFYTNLPKCELFPEPCASRSEYDESQLRGGVR